MDDYLLVTARQREWMDAFIIVNDWIRERERERVAMVDALVTVGFREGENGWCIGDHWIEK